MPPVNPIPPALQTFADRPSWLNRAGRVDRSACIELKASDLWRLVPDGDWRPLTRRAQSGPHLLADTRASVTAYQLADLHDARNPFTLKGDRRTPKSNAMKSPRRISGGANPNKGQSRIKMLGLPTDWSQALTIQRWRLHPQLAQHFFACPSCKQRALKLFLPLCTQPELRDALTAQLWLGSNEKRIARSSTLRPQASDLIARYGPLFPPRRLVCRKCLHLRYGDARRPR
jgi:hypothetical protein